VEAVQTDDALPRLTIPGRRTPPASLPMPLRPSIAATRLRHCERAMAPTL